MKYKKTLQDLEKVAIKWWRGLWGLSYDIENVLPVLLETQDKCIAFLKLADGDPERMFRLLAASSLPANVLLKHLMILSGYMGEPDKKAVKKFFDNAPRNPGSGRYFLDYMQKGAHFQYEFKALPTNDLTSRRLKVDDESITSPAALDDLTKDMIVFLLFAEAAMPTPRTKSEEHSLKDILGNAWEIDKHIRLKYAYAWAGMGR